MARVETSEANGFGIDIASDDRDARCFRCGDRQYAAAAADVDDAPGSGSQKHAVERQEAAARGGVVTGAEGGARFNLDGYGVWRPFGAVMAAMHEEPAGAHGRQTFQRPAHP